MLPNDQCNAFELVGRNLFSILLIFSVSATATRGSGNDQTVALSIDARIAVFQLQHSRSSNNITNLYNKSNFADIEDYQSKSAKGAIAKGYVDPLRIPFRAPLEKNYSAGDFDGKLGAHEYADKNMSANVHEDIGSQKGEHGFTPTGNTSSLHDTLSPSVPQAVQSSKIDESSRAANNASEVTLTVQGLQDLQPSPLPRSLPLSHANASLDGHSDAEHSSQNAIDSLTSSNKPFYMHYHLMLAIFGAILFCILGVFHGTMLQHIQCKWDVTCTLRNHVEAMPVHGWENIEKLVPRKARYDCNFSRPMNSRQLIRLEARIEGPLCANEAALTAPLSNKECVFYLVCVSQQEPGKQLSNQIAAAFASVEFIVAPIDSPGQRLSIEGNDVSVFDMHFGRCAEKYRFEDAPGHWQDFVLSHGSKCMGTEWRKCSTGYEEEGMLDFEECALLVGTTATLVGELHRGADGIMSLKPKQEVAMTVPKHFDGKSTVFKPWENTTSSKMQDGAEIPTDKVLVSDDPNLLRCRTQTKKPMRSCDT